MREFYGYWRVIKKSPDDIGDPYQTYVYCQCVCCRQQHVRLDDLTSGKSKSCGCSRSRNLLQVVGQQFNRWTVLSLGQIRNTHRYVTCRCECGYVADLRLSSVKLGKTKSCGCYRNEQVSIAVKAGWKKGKYTSNWLKKSSSII